MPDPTKPADPVELWVVLQDFNALPFEVWPTEEDAARATGNARNVHVTRYVLPESPEYRAHLERVADSWYRRLVRNPHTGWLSAENQALFDAEKARRERR